MSGRLREGARLVASGCTECIRDYIKWGDPSLPTVNSHLLCTRPVPSNSSSMSRIMSFAPRVRASHLVPRGPSGKPLDKVRPLSSGPGQKRKLSQYNFRLELNPSQVLNLPGPFHSRGGQAKANVRAGHLVFLESAPYVRSSAPSTSTTVVSTSFASFCQVPADIFTSFWNIQASGRL